MKTNNRSSVADKIALFRSLFRGREDLYPKRYESKKTGKSGYLPACANAWVRGICEKTKIRCSECRYRHFLPVTDSVIKWHLSGVDDAGKDFVLGIYPMMLDETCFFLAADFDKKSWQQDAVSFLETCHRIQVPAVMERSRSGKGAHVWVFFSEAIPAALARKLGCHILTETMEQNPDVGFDSYDRFFPNQDTLPKGGFGNLIALPLQKKARELGNSVFVNEELLAYEDQWEFLGKASKMSRLEVETIVQSADAKGRIVGTCRIVNEDDAVAPWNRQSISNKTVPPHSDVPESIEIVHSNEIYIPKEKLAPWLKNRLIRLATFQNPEFYKAQSMRLPTYETPRFITCAHEYPNHIGLPRGCLDEVCTLFSDLKIALNVRNELQTGCPLKTKFLGELRLEQKAAVKAILGMDIGVLSATTAFGKTVVAAYLIAKRKVSTLILVHRKQLQQQWIERLNTFLELPKGAIGCIGGGKKRPTGIVDVAIIQGLVRKGIVDEVVSQYGYVIVDECHHIPAVSFEQVICAAKAKFITGLTATLARKDGHHPIIAMRCGPVRYRVDAKIHAGLQPFTHHVFVRPTQFCPTKPANEDARIRFSDLYAELVANKDRNELICNDVIQAVRSGRSPIVVTERTAHLKELSERLSPYAQHLIILCGGMSIKKINETINRLTSVPEGESRIVLATGQCIGEGFDDARLDTLFLTLPISWRGTVAQYVGRLHRSHTLKREVQVYDYADLQVPLLERMFNRRCQGYENVGYSILLPASAIPGWPAQISLPVDPCWKMDYASSVRRLVQDGVDVPLANLFVKAVFEGVPLEASGVDRARSSVEIFLFRRLETLPETKGRFQLNAELDIAFDGWGKMEVDLLCADARVVIELDGNQHLADIEAYRKDRRKDVLLQESGYIVLRFLSEDVGKRLSDILDSILRVLTARQKPM